MQKSALPLLSDTSNNKTFIYDLTKNIFELNV